MERVIFHICLELVFHFYYLSLNDVKQKKERRDFLADQNLEEMRNQEEREQHASNVRKYNR